MKFLLRTSVLLGLFSLLLLSSCARMGIWQKSAMIVGTAGTAGTVMLYNNYASAASSLASGVGVGALGGATSMVVDAAEATPSQINAAEAAGRRYLEALDAAKAGLHKKPGKNLVALAVPRKDKSRGQASIMIYDTQKRRLQRAKVYDLRATPKQGDTFRFETFEAEFVGVIPMLGTRPAASVVTPVPDPLAVEPKP